VGRSCGVGAVDRRADFGQRLVGLGRNLLVRGSGAVVGGCSAAELIAERLQLVDGVGGSAGRGLAVAPMAKLAGSSRVICVPSIYHRSFGAKRSKRRHSGAERCLVPGYE
jgi:hypothetical protein